MVLDVSTHSRLCAAAKPSVLAQVVDVRIIMDRNTRRSKGFAYIEMASRVQLFNLEPHGNCVCCQALARGIASLQRRTQSYHGKLTCDVSASSRPLGSCWLGWWYSLCDVLCTPDTNTPCH